MGLSGSCGVIVHVISIILSASSAFGGKVHDQTTDDHVCTYFYSTPK